MLCSSSFISGWRATDSISLPKMKPMPMPAPIEPRPAPTPRATALPAASTPSSETAAITGDRSMKSAPFLMTGGGSSAEIDGSEGREDKCLQRCDQPDLEDEEEEGERESQGPERGDAEQDRQATTHEEQQQVAGEDVGEESDGERDQPGEVGDRLDDEDEALGGRVHVLEARGQPAGEVLEETLGADPFDVVGDPDDQGQDQRDREVGGGGVDREGGDFGAEDVDRVLGVGRQRQEADHVREPDPEEERSQEREPAAGHLRLQIAARDRVLGHVVGNLHRRLHPVRLLVHAARDPDHRPDRQSAGEDEIENGLVDAEVDAGEVDRDPRFELELVLRLEVFVFAGAAEDQHHQDRDPEVDPEADEDLGFGAEPGLRCGYRLVAHATPCPSGSSPKRCWKPWAAKETVKRTRTRTAAARPASRSARPTSRTAVAISHTRPSVVAATIPIAF